MLGALQNIHLNSSVNLDNFMKLTHILSKFFLTHILSNGDKLACNSQLEPTKDDAAYGGFTDFYESGGDQRHSSAIDAG